jgi:hypothetical protein
MIALDLYVETEPDGATVIDVFSPARSNWNDTTRLAITEGRWA